MSDERKIGGVLRRHFVPTLCAIAAAVTTTLLGGTSSCEAWIVVPPSAAAAARRAASAPPSAPARRRVRERPFAPPLGAAEGEPLGDPAAAAAPPRASAGRRRRESRLVDAAAAVTQQSCPMLGVRTLGVDYGLVRTGVAVTVGYEPRPLAILADLGAEEVCGEVVRMAASQRASRILLGLPLHRNGTSSEQSDLTLLFGRLLARHALRRLGSDVPVLLYDERYTSQAAAARVRGADPGGRRRNLHGTLDADAACILLEAYYRGNGVGAEPLELPEEARRDCLGAYEVRKRQEQTKLQAMLEEREAKLRRRKEAIARDLEEGRDASESSTKKRKKKRKRRG